MRIPLKPLLIVLLLVLAIGLRFYALDLKPPHFDEGMNGILVQTIKHVGYYQYQADKFHGPFYFYLLYFVQNTLGDTLATLRTPAVIGSLFSIILLLMSGTILGRTCSLFAALAMSVSPGAVFFARYSITESWFVFFSIATTLGILGIWKTGQFKYLAYTIIGTSGMMCTKETTSIYLVATISALIGYWALTPRFVRQAPAKQKWSRLQLGIICTLGAAAIWAMYTGGGQYQTGIFEFLNGFFAWFKQSGEEGKTQPFFYWLALFIHYEPITLVGIVVSAKFLFRSFGPWRYLSLFALINLLIYSAIPYKTPWCIINMQWPFLIILGLGIQELCSNFKKYEAYILSFCTLAICLPSLAICIPLNWKNYDSKHEPYAYVQTSRELYKALTPILDEARNKNPNNTKGVIILDSYYPLPWIFRNFPQVKNGNNINKQLQGNDQDKTTATNMLQNADFIITDIKTAPKISKHLKDKYIMLDFLLRQKYPPCRIFLRESKYANYIKK